MWMNDLYRGVDEAHTFEEQTERGEKGERGEIKGGPSSLFCGGVWSAGGPLPFGGLGGGQVCMWERERGKLTPNKTN